MENALIIFVQNAERGKVKSSLAKDIGDDQALQIHHYLLQHTRDTAVACNCSHFIFYSSYVHISDVFDDNIFTKWVQEGESLEQRISNALDKVYELDCKKVCIIGTDCYELETQTLNEAFDKLDFYDQVIGPVNEGGYYLLGTKQPHKFHFAEQELNTSLHEAAGKLSFEKSPVTSTKLEKLNVVTTVEELHRTNILTQIKEEGQQP